MSDGPEQTIEKRAPEPTPSDVEGSRGGPGTPGPLPSAASAGLSENDSLERLEREFLSNPEAVPAALDYHSAALKGGAFMRAEGAFTDALRRNPCSKRLQFLLIDLLLRQGKFVKAMDAIEGAMAAFGVDDGMLTAALSVRRRVGLRDDIAADRNVSLCMIAKNEQSHLARCLQSAKHLAGEMIVVDTGSTDRSRDIAIAFGARVFDVSWEADFAKARNAALDKAHGRWILVLDADEVISPKDIQGLKALVQDSESASIAYTIQTRNYTCHANTLAWRANDGSYPDEERGVGWFPSDKVRLFPNHPGIRFSFPVHELVEPSLKALKIPIRSCTIPVHHYGKLEETKTLEKTRDYRALGEKKLGSLPTDPAALRELAIQSSHLNRHTDAIELWRKYLEQEPRSSEAYLNLGTACWQLGRYADALEHAKCAQRLTPSLKEASFNRAIAELLLGKASAASKILERLLKKDPGYLPAGFTLAAAYACSGKTAKAIAALQPIRSTALGPHLGESFYDLAKRLRDASLGGYCEKLLKAAMRANYRDARFEDLLESVRRAA